MPFVSGYVEAPWQGISQAAAAIRQPNQATRLDDCLVDIQKGFRKRPPWRYIAKILNSGLTTGANVSLLSDPVSGDLMMSILDYESGAVTANLYDITSGASPAVTITTAAHTYLNTGAPVPQADLRTCQAVDNTFIVNRKKQVTDDPTPAASRPFEAIFWFKQGGYGFQYNLTITPNGGGAITGAVLTPDGESAADSKWINTNIIAQAMLSGSYAGGIGNSSNTPIQAALVAAGFTVKYANSVVYISHPSIDFTIVADDGQGGAAFQQVKKVTQAFTNLPSQVPQDGFTVQIAPQRADLAGSYYVSYNSNGGLNTGVWQEVIGPGSNKGILPASLPVSLVNNAGTWTIDVCAWKERAVGDATSAPDPGFVGDYLKDICLFQGRLGLLYDEGLLFCAADDPFRIYPATMTTEVDSDPFEVENPDPERAFWEYITGLYGGLGIIGQHSQTYLQNADVGDFTAKSVQTRSIAKFKVDSADKLRAITSNDRIYLAIPRDDNYLAFFEFAADRLSGRILPDDISAHVPTLLPNSVDRVASIDPNFALLYGSSGGAVLYLGIFRYANYQRVQTAWFRWFLPTGFSLAGLTAHGTVYYALVRDAAGAGHLLALDISPDLLDDDATSTVFTNLDFRCSEAQCTVSYNASANTSTVTPPTPVTSATRVSARAPSTTYDDGYLAPVVGTTGSTITIEGDWRAQTFYCGYSYSGIWQPTTIFRRSQDNKPILRARLTVSDLMVDLTDAINVYATVSQPARSLRTYLKGGMSFGAPVQQFTGQWHVPVNGQNLKATITIEDRSHLGTKVAGFAWYGHHDPFFGMVT